MKWHSLFFALCFLVFLLPHTSEAATLYMDPTETHAYRADTFSVEVRVDTDEDECINAADAVITYDPSIAAADVSLGDSIFTLWVERPTIDQEKHTITFAGGIPNGYCGRIPGDPRLTNVIAKIIFRVPGFSVGSGSTNGIANISFDPQTHVYLNSGDGSMAPLRTFGTTVHVDQKAGSSISDEWRTEVSNDDAPPSPFSIELVQNDSVFSGRHYIVFSTTDKQSGLDHYEVFEEPLDEISLFRWGEPDAVWERAESPYVLNDQRLRSVIRVKAIDKAGNEQIAIYAPEEAARVIDPLTAVLALSIGVLVLVLIVVFGLFMRRRFITRHTHEEDHVESE